MVFVTVGISHCAVCGCLKSYSAVVAPPPVVCVISAVASHFLYFFPFAFFFVASKRSERAATEVGGESEWNNQSGVRNEI